MGFMDDNEKSIKCPACGKQMQKVFLQQSKINIDICLDGCGGIYFDNRELEKFDEAHENADEIFALYKDGVFLETDQAETRTCPVCDTPMVKLGAKGNVEIDACNVCGGTFLDYGELERIRNGKVAEHINWEEMFPNESSNNKRRTFFENLAKKIF